MPRGARAPTTARRSAVAKKLRVTLVRSLIGLSPKQEATVKALGLRRIRQVVEHDDTPTIRGMIHAVPFCLKVVES
jgi:large subunit ribosomal protein L30